MFLFSFKTFFNEFSPAFSNKIIYHIRQNLVWKMFLFFFFSLKNELEKEGGLTVYTGLYGILFSHVYTPCLAPEKKDTISSQETQKPKCSVYLALPLTQPCLLVCVWKDKPAAAGPWCWLMRSKDSHLTSGGSHTGRTPPEMELVHNSDWPQTPPPGPQWLHAHRSAPSTLGTNTTLLTLNSGKVWTQLQHYSAHV